MRKPTLSIMLRALFLALMLTPSLARMAKADPVAFWSFDEGKGNVAHDITGNGHDAKLQQGAAFVRQGRGFALGLDGVDDFAKVSQKFDLAGGPIAFELWIKPMRKAHGMSCIIGESLSSFLLTYYNTELCQLYIGDGGNSVKGQITLDAWNHVVGSFDGTHLTMWVNGRRTGHNESKVRAYKTFGVMAIGTDGQPQLPRFTGLIDDLRVYNRGLSEDEVIQHFNAEAGDHDFDTAWFTRVRLTPYYYFDRGQIVVEANYQELRPLEGAARIEATLASQDSPEQPIEQQNVASLPPAGRVDLKFAADKLEPGGKYVISVLLTDANGARAPEEVKFDFTQPTIAPLASPAQKTLPPLPVEEKSKTFTARAKPGGGFEIALNGRNYPFRTRISVPNGDFNHLSTDGSRNPGESSWKVSLRSGGKQKYIVEAKGKHYALRRQIEVFATHVYVTDTYANLTNEDLGLLVYNETPVDDSEIIDSRLSGYERRGRQVELTYPDYGPSTFFTDSKNGMGIIPIDDVFVVHAVPYIGWEGAAGVATEKLAIAPNSSYTLEWAVYPTASKDYYDFINTFRRVEGRIGTMAENAGFISNSPRDRYVVPDDNFIKQRNLTLGLIHCLSYSADDPDLHIEGIELLNFPIEMQRMRELAAALRQKHPNLKAAFHVAHSLYCTNDPDRFADSKVIGPDGKQVTWGNGDAFGPKRQAEGWRWWIFYPTPGNSFHEELLKSVDVIMDDLGYSGIFLDGFLAGYGAMWTYDRWDGHSAEIDTRTKKITRKLGSVILLSQPSMIEVARKIRDKGGAVVALHTVFTRSITKENYILFSNECATGPELHLAPTVTALAGSVPIRTETDLYRDMLDKLNWGELFIYYGAMFDLVDPMLAAFQTPITFEDIRAGTVRGPQRILTSKSGVYGWQYSSALHLVRKFDPRGVSIRHEFITAVDPSGDIRTEINLQTYESAVIEPLPIDVSSDVPVNARVTRFDNSGLTLELNGNGNITLVINNERLGGKCAVLVNDRAVDGNAASKEISVPINLSGPTTVQVKR